MTQQVKSSYILAKSHLISVSQYIAIQKCPTNCTVSLDSRHVTTGADAGVVRVARVSELPALPYPRAADSWHAQNRSTVQRNNPPFDPRRVDFHTFSDDALRANQKTDRKVLRRSRDTLTRNMFCRATFGATTFAQNGIWPRRFFLTIKLYNNHNEHYILFVDLTCTLWQHHLLNYHLDQACVQSMFMGFSCINNGIKCHIIDLTRPN